MRARSHPTPFVPDRPAPTPTAAARRRTRLAVALRRATARRPSLYWLAVAVLAGGSAATVYRAVDRAEAARATWGTSRPVLVTTAEITPGEPVTARLVPLPLAALPDQVMVDPDDLVDRVAAQRLSAGEIVTRHDLVPPGALARIPNGWRAVAVVESPPSLAAIGERVDVAADGIVIAHGALVIERGDGVTVIATEATRAASVAAADEAGAVTLLRGAGDH